MMALHIRSEHVEEGKLELCCGFQIRDLMLKHFLKLAFADLPDKIRCVPDFTAWAFSEARHNTKQHLRRHMTKPELL